VWPAERFYWAVAETPKGVRTDGLPSRTLLGLVEDELPLDSENLHAVGVSLDESHLLVCAIPAKVLAELDGSVLTLRPAGIPEEVLARRNSGGQNGTANVLSSLNLLIREFEPAALRDERGRRRWTIAAGLVLAGLLAIGGLERRVSMWRDGARRVDEQTARLVREVTPDIAASLTATEGGTDNAWLGRTGWLLEQEIGTLRRLQDPRIDQTGADVPAAFASILAAWPKDEKLRSDVRVDYITVTPETVSMSVVTKTNPGVFLQQFHAPTGWTAIEPRLVASSRGTQLSLTFSRDPAVVAPKAKPSVSSSATAIATPREQSHTGTTRGGTP
jgi:hypothetical protein